jgi:hypothetical protein
VARRDGLPLWAVRGQKVEGDGRLAWRRLGRRLFLWITLAPWTFMSSSTVAKLSSPDRVRTSCSPFARRLTGRTWSSREAGSSPQSPHRRSASRTSLSACRQQGARAGVGGLCRSSDERWAFVRLSWAGGTFPCYMTNVEIAATKIRSVEDFIGVRANSQGWPHAWFRGEPGSVPTPLVPRLYRPRSDGTVHNEDRLVQLFRMKAPHFAGSLCPQRGAVD